jgi:hypothetical protein
MNRWVLYFLLICWQIPFVTLGSDCFRLLRLQLQQPTNHIDLIRSRTPNVQTSSEHVEFQFVSHQGTLVVPDSLMFIYAVCIVRHLKNHIYRTVPKSKQYTVCGNRTCLIKTTSSLPSYLCSVQSCKNLSLARRSCSNVLVWQAQQATSRNQTKISIDYLDSRHSFVHLWQKNNDRTIRFTSWINCRRTKEYIYIERVLLLYV